MGDDSTYFILNVLTGSNLSYACVRNKLDKMETALSLNLMKAWGREKKEPYLSFVFLIIEPSGVLVKDEFVISVSYIFIVFVEFNIEPYHSPLCAIVE